MKLWRSESLWSHQDRKRKPNHESGRLFSFNNLYDEKRLTGLERSVKET